MNLRKAKTQRLHRKYIQLEHDGSKSYRMFHILSELKSKKRKINND